MKTIPSELEDAARIDGTNEFGIYWHIALPISAPSIALVTIYNAVPVWNDFFFPLVFIQSDSKKPLPLGLTSFLGQYDTDWGLVFSGLTVAIMPILILYLFMSRYFIKGMTMGAIK
jgi:raffinose/stachyose/melibiose transport system permease protein